MDSDEMTNQRGLSRLFLIVFGGVSLASWIKKCMFFESDVFW